MTSPTTTAPLPENALFADPEVLILHLNPRSAAPWYCARQIVELLGRAWKNAESTLKQIPEHHKAELGHRTSGGYQNLWALSRIGVLLYHRHVTGGYPLGLSAAECAEVEGVTNPNSAEGADESESIGYKASGLARSA